jgi:antitoxin FitA
MDDSVRSAADSGHEEPRDRAAARSSVPARSIPAAARGLDNGAGPLHASDMPKSLVLRNVPDDLHRTLKARAAAARMPLAAWLVRELTRVATWDSEVEMGRRLATRRAAARPASTVEWVREERERNRNGTVPGRTRSSPAGCPTPAERKPGGPGPKKRSSRRK